MSSISSDDEIAGYMSDNKEQEINTNDFIASRQKWGEEIVGQTMKEIEDAIKEICPPSLSPPPGFEGKPVSPRSFMVDKESTHALVPLEEQVQSVLEVDTKPIVTKPIVTNITISYPEEEKTSKPLSQEDVAAEFERKFGVKPKIRKNFDRVKKKQPPDEEYHFPEMGKMFINTKYAQEYTVIDDQLGKITPQFFETPIPTVATESIAIAKLPEVPMVSNEFNEQIFKQVNEAAQEFIKILEGAMPKDVMDSLSTCVSVTLVTSLTSSVMSIVTSIYTLVNNDNTKVGKILHSTTLLLSLTNTIAIVASVCKHWKTYFNLKRATDSIHEYMEMIANTVKANDNTTYINAAVTALIAIISTGSVACGFTTVKDVISAGSLSRAIREFRTDANEITELICEDLLQLDLKGDKLLYDKLVNTAQRCVQLTTIPTYEFAAKGELSAELMAFPDKAIELCSKPIFSKTKSRALLSAKQLLNQNMTAVKDKISALRSIRNQRNRIETIAVHLTGAPGIGKSHLVHHLTKQLGALFGYPADLYNLSKQTNGFHLPYGGAAFGVVNEFMAGRCSEDPFLHSYNVIVSSDPASLESAHLEGKDQPVQFKVVFLTSNTVNPDISANGGLTKNAAIAVWSRTLRYHIADDMNEGRMASNLHRKPDFSHLTVNKITTNGPSLADEALVRTPFSVQKMFGEIAEQMARREISFMNAMNFSPEELAAMEPRKLALQHIVDNNRTANAEEGRNFFVIRLQGIAGTGKSKLVNEIAAMLKSHLIKMKVVRMEAKDFKDAEKCYLRRFYEETPAIYIVDDVLYDKQDKMNYFTWINKTHYSSIVLLATNEIYVKKKQHYIPFISEKLEYYQVPQHETDLPEGYFRRIGLNGHVYYKDHWIMNSQVTGFTLNCGNNYVLDLNGESVNHVQALDKLYKAYIDYYGTLDKLVWVDEMPPHVDSYDVDVYSDSPQQLAGVLSSVRKIGMAYIKTCDGTRFKVSDDFGRRIYGATAPTDWLVKEKVETMDDWCYVAERMAAAVRRVSPKSSVRLVIANYLQIIVTDNKLYRTIHDGNYNKDPFFFVRGDVICCEEGPISVEEVVDYIVHDKLSKHLYSVPQQFLREIRNIISVSGDKSLLAYKTAITIATTESQVKIDTKLVIKEFIRNHKVISILGGLVSAYILYKLGSKLYRWLTKKEPNKLISNTGPEDELTSKYLNRIRERVLTGQKYDDIYHEAGSKGLHDKLKMAELDWRTGNYKPPVVSNMLSIHEVFQTDTPLDDFMAKLQKHYVVLTNRNGARCYGLCIGGNDVLTVSHLISQMDEEITVQSNGLIYNALPYKINRNSDQALLKITSKQWQPASSLTKNLLSYEDAINSDSVWYIRISQGKPMAFKTTAYFTPTTRIPHVDPSNPNFSLCEDYWTIECATMRSMREVIRDGDCGMPLVVHKDNQYYVVGIHNAYSQMGTCHFSLVYKQDMAIARREVSSNSLKVCEADPQYCIVWPTTGKKLATMPYLKDIVSSGYEISKFNGQVDIKLWGFNRKLLLVSKPKNKYIYDSTTGLKREKDNSALQYLRGMDSVNLVKDVHGVPHTLMTQANFYSLRHKEYKSWDNKKFEVVESIMLARYHRDYGSLRRLNIKETINGLPYLNPVDVDTSPGPYFKLRYQLTDKQKIFNNMAAPGRPPFYEIADNEYGKELKEQLSYYSDAVSRGVPIFVLSKDNAKVELIPIEKAKKGNVRLFNEVDIAFNLVLKRYFGLLMNRCQERWMEGPYAIGANHYLLGSFIRKKFSLYPGGTIANTDYSKFDKSLPPELISAFCRVALHWAPVETQEAIAHSLIHVLHTLDGHVYSVNNGNESGTLVTTILNCFCVEFVNIYTFVEWFHSKTKKYPSLKDFEAKVAHFICGDDATLIYHQDCMNLDLRMEVNKKFNLNLTDAKLTSGFPSFCSREIIYDPIYSAIAYPALKTSSITACLMYFTPDKKIETIAANCNVALFEASLHDKEFFTMVYQAVVKLAERYSISHNVNWITYEQYREHFTSYILGISNSPTLLALEGQITKNFEVQSNHFEKQNLNKQQTTQRANDQYSSIIDTILSKMDSKSTLFTYAQKNKLSPPIFVDTRAGEAHTPVWTSIVTIVAVDGNEHQGSGIATSKAHAQQVACRELVYQLTNVVKPNTDTPFLPTIPASTEPLDFNTIMTKFSLERNEEGTIFLINNAGEIVLRAGDVRSMRSLMATFLEVGADEYYRQQITDNFTDLTQIDEFSFGHLVYVFMDPEFKKTTFATGTKSIYSLPFGHFVCHEEKKIGYMDLSEFHTYNYSQVKALTSTMKHFKYDKTGIYLSYQDIWNIENERFELQQSIAIAQDGGITTEAKANSEIQVAASGVTMAQAAVNEAQSSIPVVMGPQPTPMAPAMEPSGMNIVATKEITEVNDLNSIGPSSTLISTGGITFDIKQLCYGNYLDSDQLIEVAEDLPAGSVIAQIPYDPNGIYMNSAIKQYVKLHGRYAGPLLIRVTVIGNPWYSGLIGICWQPRKITTPTIKMSQAQMYSFMAKEVCAQWNVVFALHDARKNNFYRETTDTDIDDRPHLVFFTMVRTKNAASEEAVLRFRIASKLSNGGDMPGLEPFLCAQPLLQLPEAINVGLSSQSWDIPFLPFFMKTASIASDGTKEHESRIIGEGDINKVYDQFPSNSSLAGYAQNANGDSEIEAWALNWCATVSYNKEDFPDVTVPDGYKVYPYVRSNGNGSKLGINLLAQEIKIKETSTYNYVKDKIKGLALKPTTEAFIGNELATKIFEGFLSENWIVESWRVVTVYGTFTFNFGVLLIKDNEIVSRLSALPKDMANFVHDPIIPIDTTVLSFEKGKELPLGTLSLIITSIPLSTITFDGYRGPTATTDRDFLDYLEYASKGLSATQVLQVYFRDSRNLATMVVARFDSSNRQLYFKPSVLSKLYAVAPISLRYLNVSLEIVNIANDLPVTDNSSWANRVNPTLAQMMLKRGFVPEIRMEKASISTIAKANAMAATMIGGGILQGLGSGLGALGQQQAAMKMLRETHAQQLLLQGNEYGQRTYMQDAEHHQQTAMQERQIRANSNWQEKAAAQQSKLQQAEFQQQFKRAGWTGENQFV